VTACQPFVAKQNWDGLETYLAEFLTQNHGDTPFFFLFRASVNLLGFAHVSILFRFERKPQIRLKFLFFLNQFHCAFVLGGLPLEQLLNFVFLNHFQSTFLKVG
jgi:hypothetical protein